MNIYVLRHGQTDWNKEGIILSRENIPLNETGINQAMDASQIVENLDYDLIISSPLIRTLQTAEIVNKKRNKKIIIDERLIERDAGTLSGRNGKDEIFKDYWNLDAHFEGLENLDELFARVSNFMDEIKEKYKDKNLLIVTHNGVCRGIKIYCEGYPKTRNIAKLGQDNCEIRMYKI